MKILFVCQQYIHSARWIHQLKDTEHQIYVFDCLDNPIHKDLLWTNYTTDWQKRKIPYIKGEHFIAKKLPRIYDFISQFLKVTASERLEKLIKEIKPDLVHSLEMLTQSYPLLKVHAKLNFLWAYSSWGSDMFLYHHNKNHQLKIKRVLSRVSFFFSDNSRDYSLAKQLGYKNECFEVLPGGGGYHLDTYQSYKKPQLSRNLILIKGYQHWVGRALKVLEALALINSELQNYPIYVYSAHEVVVDKIQELKQKYQLNIQYSTRQNELSHEEILKKFGAAKLAVGNSISDGVPNTLLEAIILGAFPIQSNPGGASEDYIENGKNGILIENSEDENEIANHIKLALNSPELLINAYAINSKKAKKLAYEKVQRKVLDIYKKIADEK